MAKLEKVSFDDALDLTGFGKFNWLTFLLCGSIIMGMAFETFSVAYLVPASACELLTTSGQQGLMAAVPLVGIIATSHFWGFLADTRGRKKILCFSMTLSFISGALAAFAPDWITFSIFKFLSSSSVSGAFALSITLLSECTPPSKRSSLIILTSTVFLVCNGSMAILTMPVLPLQFDYYVPFLNIHFNSWRLLDLIFSFPCAISAFGLLFSYESPKYFLTIGEEEKSLEILRTIYTINNKKSGDEYPVKSLKLDEDNENNTHKGFLALLVSQTVPLFRPPLLKKTLLLSLIFITVYICINPYMVWLPFMADGFMRSVNRGEQNLTFCERLKASQNSVQVQEDGKCGLNNFAMTLVFGIGLLLGLLNTIVTAVVNYVPRKAIFITFQFTAGLSAMLLNATTEWYVGAIFFFTFISGVINFGMLSSFCVDVYPTYVKAMAVCLTLMFGRGSAVFGINILKMLLDGYCETSFYIFGSIALVGGLLGLVLPSETKPANRRCPET